MTRANDAMDRREADADSRGCTTRKVTAMYAVDGGFEDWSSCATTGLVESWNGE
jgi:hypothetical protein